MVNESVKNESKVVKPITLVREDFIKNILECCNNSNLPLFVIESVLLDIVKEVHLANEKQTEADRKRYSEEIEKEKSNK